MREFDLIGEITDVEMIARGPGIRDIARLNRQYGKGKWRKLNEYVVCIDNSDYPTSLERHKIYKVVPDRGCCGRWGY